MRRLVLWFASTVTVVVLLFGYHTSTEGTEAASATPSASSPATPASSPSSAAPSATTPSATTPAGASTASKTVTGSVASTRWGPVQVQLTVKAGTVTEVTVLQQPDGNPRDTEINAQALPVLVQETLSAQSAQIDMVSGATVTSTGYVQSLQAALDAAGI